MRTVASVEPPGGKVTIMRIGLAGQAVCARLAAASEATAVPTARARTNRFTLISGEGSGRMRAGSDPPVDRDLLEQLEQHGLLQLGEVAEQLFLHVACDALRLAHERRALAGQGDVLLATIVVAARARDQLAFLELVADQGQARRRDLERGATWRCVTFGLEATSIRIVKSMRRSWNGSPIRFLKILKLGIAACARL